MYHQHKRTKMREKEKEKNTQPTADPDAMTMISGPLALSR
jgi:hypothetical protein